MPKRKLTDAQVREILAWHRSRRYPKQVAREYGINVVTLSKIVNGRNAYGRRLGS